MNKKTTKPLENLFSRGGSTPNCAKSVGSGEFAVQVLFGQLFLGIFK